MGNNKFEGKTIVVTGAGGDIGSAVAVHFAQEGASVALLDIAKLELAKEKVSSAGRGNVKTYECDVTNYEQVKQAVQQIVVDFGRIDMLFNNAGLQGAFKKTFEYPEDDFSRIMQVNLIGAFHVLKLVTAHMVKNKNGCVVNTASMAGVDGPPNMIAYGASKFAVIGMTQTASKDLAPYGIRVNSISPAFMGPGFMWDRQVELQSKADSQYFSSDPKIVEKEMIGQVPMRRYGDIREIPGTVAYLMSDDSSYVTGVNIPISGGI
ncbi:MAG: SDR family oxidoreductase [Spirochaetales bacterium]|nr:SDR family oxidoreductase [Spirochaetales bacterium]